VTDPYSRVAIRASLERRKLVVGNWKMNPVTIPEAVTLARLACAIESGDVDVGVAPPSIALPAVAEALRGTTVQVYAQDVHWKDAGGYTGQVSAAMLTGLADGSIVGHSEVRRDQGDDDARVAAKATAALRHGLSVIYCIGESLEQRKRGETAKVIERQIRQGLATVDPGLLVSDGRYRFAVAYEPIWAIGTGVVATPAQVSEAIAKVREELVRVGFGEKAATIMYGGSVTAANCVDCAGAEGVDGALVGGASLKVEEFAAIVAAFRSDPRS
jgi:triosephosphate isomerase